MSAAYLFLYLSYGKWIILIRPANINCMFYLSLREHFANNQEKIHATKNTQNVFFVYFWKVCVC